MYDYAIYRSGLIPIWFLFQFWLRNETFFENGTVIKVFNERALILDTIHVDWLIQFKTNERRRIRYIIESGADTENFFFP